MRLYIGTSGYNFSHWGNGVFYPGGVPAEKWLEFYSRQFNGLELAATAHQLPTNADILEWLRSTPREFRFAVKGPNFITHIKRLKNVRDSLETTAENIKSLKPKVACFLWQLPSGFQKDPPTLADFCSLLKQVKLFRDFRHVFEFADHSWFSADVYRILKDARCCLCFTDSPEKPGEWTVTTDFLYLRFNGGRVFYDSHYSRKELEEAANKVRSFRDQVQTIYAFFNNDEQGFAVYNAQMFRMLLLERRMI